MESIHVGDGLLRAPTLDQHPIRRRDDARAVDTGAAADEHRLRRLLDDRQNLRHVLIQMPVRQNLYRAEVPHAKVDYGTHHLGIGTHRFEGAPHVELQAHDRSDAVRHQPLRIRAGRRLGSPQHPRPDHTEIAYRRAEIVGARPREGAPGEVHAPAKKQSHRARNQTFRRAQTAMDDQHLATIDFSGFSHRI